MVDVGVDRGGNGGKPGCTVKEADDRENIRSREFPDGQSRRLLRHPR